MDDIAADRFASPSLHPEWHDPARQLPVLLHRTREALASQLRPVFLLHDLSDPQWRVLRILSAGGELDVSELARRSYLLGPSLSRILRDLAARDLISRRVSEEDARRSFHALTNAGHRVIDEVAPFFDPIFKDIEHKLGRERIVQLNAMLAELLDTLKESD